MSSNILSQPSQLFSTNPFLNIYFYPEADGLALVITEQHNRVVLYEMVT